MISGSFWTRCYAILSLDNDDIDKWYARLEAGFVAGNMLMQGWAMGTSSSSGMMWTEDPRWQGWKKIMNAQNKIKRRENEKKFGKWEELPDGGRKYTYVVKGRYGWSSHYIKEVDADEQTLRFYQNIYDDNGLLVEIHEKYPEDKGHKKIKDISHENNK